MAAPPGSWRGGAWCGCDGEREGGLYRGVQGPVAQSFGFTDPVLAGGRERLCPAHHVMAAKRALEPCGVGGEEVKWL
jgi:hypothetical protein